MLTNKKMLTKLTIKNYKSLENVTLTPGPLTVLVGPNASGKSNILDALELLTELIPGRKRIKDALAERGGYSSIVWGGDTQRNITIEIEWRRQQKSGAKSRNRLSITIGMEKKRCVFRSEALQLDENQLIVRDSETTWRSDRRTRGLPEGHSDASFLTLLGGDESFTQVVFDYLTNWVFHDFDPHLMRPPQPVKKEYRLSERGENLSTVIHTLYSAGDPSLTRILESVRSSVPAVEQLSSPITEDGKTYVALREKNVPESTGSWGLSEGTLFSLALATALYTPEMPSLLALESPDTTLHPYVMESVAEMLKIASRKTQVIVTTHSPYLLDYLPPEAIVIVEKIDGKTTCKPIKGRKGVKKATKALGLGEMWYSGHLGGVP